MERGRCKSFTKKGVKPHGKEAIYCSMLMMVTEGEGGNVARVERRESECTWIMRKETYTTFLMHLDTNQLFASERIIKKRESART